MVNWEMGFLDNGRIDAQKPGRSPGSSWWSILNLYYNPCNFVTAASYVAKGVLKGNGYRRKEAEESN
jgi:hypothetical protein